MERSTVESIVSESLTPVSRRVDAFIESEQESRRVMATLITRLTTVIAGDKEFKQPGLVDTVDAHDKALSSIADRQTEVTASIRTALWIGGGLVTLINVAIQLFLK